MFAKHQCLLGQDGNSLIPFGVGWLRWKKEAARKMFSYPNISGLVNTSGGALCKAYSMIPAKLQV